MIELLIKLHFKITCWGWKEVLRFSGWPDTSLKRCCNCRYKYCFCYTQCMEDHRADFLKKYAILLPKRYY